MKTTVKLGVAAVAVTGLAGIGVGTVWAATSGGGSGGTQSGTNWQQMMSAGARGMMGSGANGMMGAGASGMMGSGMGAMWSTTASLPAPIQGAQQLSVVSDDDSLTPSTLTVTAGSAVNIQVRNTDTDVHAFAIPTLGVHTTIQPGQSVTFGLKVATAGTHQLMSMDPASGCVRGVLTVTG